MKTLKQIQKENRKAIIMACNPGAKTYEEALEMELSVGCVVIDILNQFFGSPDPTPMTLIEDTGDDSFYFTHYRASPVLEFKKEEILDKNRFEIIDKPLTLNRILIAFNKYNSHISWDYETKHDIFISSKKNTHPRATWDLTKETLEEQLEETQICVWKLLIGE